MFQRRQTGTNNMTAISTVKRNWNKNKKVTEMDPYCKVFSASVTVARADDSSTTILRIFLFDF